MSNALLDHPSPLRYRPDFLTVPQVAGLDEAGRGPLAGPVVAAAVVFPGDYQNDRFQDSKALTARTRMQLFSEIKQAALSWSIVAVGPRRIECLNIREASRLAMRLALERVEASYALIDGDTPIITPLPQQTVIQGDALITHISAASILAKVYRDRLMETLGARYPGYGLEKHAGYPTKAHREAIIQRGPSRVHRRTFRGVMS
jgi:ribonuclease HII